MATSNSTAISNMMFPGKTWHSFLHLIYLAINLKTAFSPLYQFPNEPKKFIFPWQGQQYTFTILPLSKKNCSGQISLKKARKTSFKIIAVGVQAIAIGEKDWNQLQWNKRLRSSPMQGEVLEGFWGKLVSVVLPSVFVNWCPSQLGFYSPTETGRQGPSLPWWLYFKGTAPW